MHLFDFKVIRDTFAVVGNDDELMLVHRDALAVDATIYIGCHQEGTFTVRSATNLETVEAAAPWITQAMPSGGKLKIHLPGTGNPIHTISLFKPTSGIFFVNVESFGEFNGYFKQVNVNNS